MLIADDERDTADTLAEVLRDEGHVVHVVYSGADVLARLSLLRPDAVILDVNLPKVSGFAIAQATRFGFTNVRRPMIIAISGFWTDTPDRIVGKQVGFDHYLVKPARPSELVRLLAGFRRDA